MLRLSFLENYKAIEEAIFKGEIVQFAKNTNLSKEALAQFLSQSLQVCLNAALNLEELELKAKSEALNLEKIRSEIELSLIAHKAQIRQNQAETNKSLIQAAAMIRSVKDNAAINKANAYVGLLNVVGNSSEQTAIKGHVNNVIATINQIDTSAMPSNLNKDLEKILNENENLKQKEVIIHAPKMLLELNEFIEIKGFSSLGEKPCRFVLSKDGRVIHSLENVKSYLFHAKEEGKIKITFEVFNANTWLKDELELKIIQKN